MTFFGLKQGRFGEPGRTPPPRFPHLCPEMHAMAKMAKKSPASSDLNGCQKWPLGDWQFWRK